MINSSLWILWSMMLLCWKVLVKLEILLSGVSSSSMEVVRLWFWGVEGM